MNIKNSKAIFFSIDALIAIILIFTTLIVVYPIIKYSTYETSISSDIMNVLSNIEIGEIDNSYVEELINDGQITNLNKSILEQIGEFYITNITVAKNLTKSVLSEFNSSDNIGIWFGDELIYSINSTPFEIAKNIETDRQFISGIEKGKLIKGFVAKAWLRKISEKESSLFKKGDNMCGGWKTYSWGDYCDTIKNNISYKFNIPENATIINATWLFEGSWVGQYDELYINGNNIFKGNINYYKIIDITSYVNSGNNTADFYSSLGGDDGASHIVVKYTIPDMQTFQQQVIFPFNILTSKSVLHYEKSLFIPTQISKINITINASLNTTLSFRKGAQIFEIGKKEPVNNRIIFSDDEIKNNLSVNGINYSNLSNEYFFFILDIGKDKTGQLTSLGSDSYVYIESSEIEIPYGFIDIVQEIPITQVANNLQNTFYRYLVWTFYLPINSLPILADWQFGWLSTSLEGTSQKADANSVNLYNSPPDDFINAFNRLGYTPTKGEGVFKNGENNLTLEFGSTYSVSNQSSYGYIIYFIKNYVNYGDAKEKAQGGIKTITFEDGSTEDFIINNQSDPWDPEIDALDDAVERLISQLDANNNSKIDLILNEQDFNIDIMDISGVPYVWTTEVQVRRWK